MTNRRWIKTVLSLIVFTLFLGVLSGNVYCFSWDGNFPGGKYSLEEFRSRLGFQFGEDGDGIDLWLANMAIFDNGEIELIHGGFNNKQTEDTLLRYIKAIDAYCIDRSSSPAKMHFRDTNHFEKLLLAISCIMNGEWEFAYKASLEVYEELDYLPSAKRFLGISLYHMGRYEEALKYFVVIANEIFLGQETYTDLEACVYAAKALMHSNSYSGKRYYLQCAYSNNLYDHDSSPFAVAGKESYRTEVDRSIGYTVEYLSAFDPDTYITIANLIIGADDSRGQQKARLKEIEELRSKTK